MHVLTSVLEQARRQLASKVSHRITMSLDHCSCRIHNRFVHMCAWSLVSMSLTSIRTAAKALTNLVKRIYYQGKVTDSSTSSGPLALRKSSSSWLLTRSVPAKIRALQLTGPHFSLLRGINNMARLLARTLYWACLVLEGRAAISLL